MTIREDGNVGAANVLTLISSDAGIGVNEHHDPVSEATVIVPLRIIEEAIGGNQRPLIRFYEEHRAGTKPKATVTPVAKLKAEAIQRDVERVFEYHVDKVWGRTKRGKRPTLNPSIERRIRCQLTKEGYTAEDLIMVIDESLRDPWRCGENPRNTEYLAISNIFKYDGSVQTFLDRAHTTLADGHTNVRNVHENRSDTRSTLQELAVSMRNGTATIDDKGRFSALLAKVREWGEGYSWETDKFTKI